MIVPGARLPRRSPGGTGPKGWAIPTATDIAFALAVLAVISTHLPTALRTFLLTLAVVDDLLAITVIALFYSKDLHLQWMLLALLPLAVFAVLVQRGISHWYLLLPLAFATWALVHASGIHATVAGVLLGFMVPVRPRKGADPKAPGLAEHFEHLVRPVSAGFAVPVFAFFSAGVMLGGMAGLKSALTDPIAIGIIAGLVVGKPIGILIATFITSKVTRQPLQKGLTWPDVTGVAILGGIGFTVSLLIGELAFGGNSEADDHVKIAVLAGSVARRGDRGGAAADPQQALPRSCGRRRTGTRTTTGSRTSTSASSLPFHHRTCLHPHTATGAARDAVPPSPHPPAVAAPGRRTGHPHRPGGGRMSGWPSEQWTGYVERPDRCRLGRRSRCRPPTTARTGCSSRTRW